MTTPHADNNLVWHWPYALIMEDDDEKKKDVFVEATAAAASFEEKRDCVL